MSGQAKHFSVSVHDLDWDDGLDRATGDVEASHGVRWKTLTGDGARPSAAITTGFAEIGAGGLLAPHTHADDEVYYITGGAGRVTIGTGADQKAYAVKPGDTVFIPGNARHMVEVADDAKTPLTFFYVFATETFNDVEYVFE